MKLLFISLFTVFTCFSFAQKELEYSLDLPIEIQKEKHFEKLSAEWLQKQNSKIIRSKEDTIWASSSISFTNTVIYEKSKTYNRIYREQSNGEITFQIKLYIYNKHLKVSLSHFKHQPKMQFENLNFGLITNNLTPPKEVEDMTDSKYSKDVWNLIKENIEIYTHNINTGSDDMVLK